MDHLISADEFRQTAEVFCAAQIDEQIANETDPEARAFLRRNREQILHRYVELSCAFHSGRLQAERDRLRQAGQPAGPVH